MKKIILKKLGNEGESGVLYYKEMIKNLLQFPQDAQKGFTVDEIRANLRILEALEKSDTELTLEDADHEKLKTIIESAKFGMAHKNIVEFVDDIKQAENIEIKKE